MHAISEDRAAAQWQAIFSLPLKFAQRFHKRFIDEQFALAQAVVSVAVDVSQQRRVREMPGIQKASTEEHVAALTDTAACVAEVIRREAGKALRSVSADEVNQCMRAMDTMLEPTKFTDPDECMNRLLAVRQERLLTGALVAATSGDALIRNPLGVAPPLRLVVECLDAVAEEPSSQAERDAFWGVDRAEEVLAVSGDPMRREALAWAESHRAELTPRLLAELQAWVDDPAKALDDDLALGTHAVFLLAKWREPAAWPLLRSLFSLDADTLDGLFADLITYWGSVLLASVAQGHTDELAAMVENEAVDEFSRDAALKGMACLVAWRESPRAELVGYLREWLKGRLHASEDNFIWSGIFETAAAMEAWELAPELADAEQRGLFDPAILGADFLEEAKGEPPGKLSARFLEKHPPIQDVADATPWLDELRSRHDDDLSEEDEEPMELSPDELAIPVPPETYVPPQPYLAPPKIGRNDPCPCGSGKKYKKCCGK